MAGFFDGLSRSFQAYAERHSRLNQIHRLNAKSDEELTVLGLTRSGIPRHVYRDIFFV